MSTLLRLACASVLLLGTAATTPAAAQGRNDHDTPATERQSRVGAPWQYDARSCRTDNFGWVVCRDRSGHWRRDHLDPRVAGDWWPGGGGWSWEPRPVLSRDAVIGRLHRRDYARLRDIDFRHDVYTLKALDPHGQRVRLTVDAFTGRIIRSERY